MTRVTDAIIYLTRQGLALRGDDENEELCNRGNFLELLSLLSTADSDFGEHFRTLPSNAKYTSPDIQNELISIAASQIREDICREAAGAAMIAITVDDTKDISQKEQMSLCIRFTLLPGNVREQFLMLKHMTDDAKSLSEAILSSLQSLGLDTCTIVAQC